MQRLFVDPTTDAADPALNQHPKFLGAVPVKVTNQVQVGALQYGLMMMLALTGNRVVRIQFVRPKPALKQAASAGR